MVRRLRTVMLLVLTSVGFSFSARELYTRLFTETVPEFVADFRAQSRGLVADVIGVICRDPSAVDSVDRSRLIAVGWECMPAKVCPVSAQAEPLPVILVASAFLGKTDLCALEARGYEVRRRGEFAAVWSKTELPPVTADGAPARWREALGVLAVSALLAGLWGLWARRTGTTVGGMDLLFAIGIAALVAAVVLRHPLLAPNGLGVYGGKARLWWLANGIPSGFWTDPGYATLQPAYPPGLALVALVAFAVAGGPGDWLVQLVESVIAGLLYLTLAAGRERNRVNRLFAIAFVLSPVALQLYSGFYAEPLAALCIAMGLRALVVRREFGWWLIGATALFRPEGLPLAALLSLYLGTDPKKIGVKALIFGVLWQITVLGCGGRMQDYELTLASWSHWATVAAGLGRGLVGNALQGGGLIAAGLIGWGGVGTGPGGNERKIALFRYLWLIAVVAVGFLIGFNQSEHFDWVVRMTLPRYLWLASVPFIFSLRGGWGFAIISHQMRRDRCVPDNI